MILFPLSWAKMYQALDYAIMDNHGSTGKRRWKLILEATLLLALTSLTQLYYGLFIAIGGGTVVLMNCLQPTKVIEPRDERTRKWKERVVDFISQMKSLLAIGILMLVLIAGWLVPMLRNVNYQVIESTSPLLDWNTFH